MTSKLFQLLRKPTLWQRSPEPFWDDEHITKGMLDIHLSRTQVKLKPYVSYWKEVFNGRNYNSCPTRIS